VVDVDREVKEVVVDEGAELGAELPSVQPAGITKSTTIRIAARCTRPPAPESCPFDVALN